MNSLIKKIIVYILSIIIFIGSIIGYIPVGLVDVYAADKVNLLDVTPDLDKFSINRRLFSSYMYYYLPDMIIGDDGNLYAGTMQNKLYVVINETLREMPTVSPDGKWTIPFSDYKFSKFCGNGYVLSEDKLKIYQIIFDSTYGNIYTRVTSDSPIAGVLGSYNTYITEDDLLNGFSKEFNGPDNSIKISWTYDSTAESSTVSFYGKSQTINGKVIDFYYDNLRRTGDYLNYLYIETEDGIYKVSISYSDVLCSSYADYHGLGGGRSLNFALGNENGTNPVGTEVLCYDDNNSIYDLTNDSILSSQDNLIEISDISIDYSLNLLFPKELNEGALSAGSFDHICKWADLNIDFTEDDLVDDEARVFTCSETGNEYSVKPSEYDSISLDTTYSKISDADCENPEIYGVISPLTGTTIKYYENGYALGHLWEKDENNNNKKYNETAATCSEEGGYDYYCTRCNEYVHQTIPKLSHTFSSNTAVVKEPTCTEGGFSSRVCSACGETEYDYYKGLYGEQSWLSSYKTNLTDPLGHDWVLAEDTATCVHDGVKTYECSRCDETKSEPSAKSDNHKFHIITTSATCTEDGYSKLVCDLCGEEFIDSYQEALGHDYVSQITQAPTCEEDGIETFTCSRCGDSYTERIEKTAHQYSSEVTTEPTCTEKGVKTYTCTLCGDSYTEDIPSNGHSWAVTHVTEPTTTTEGLYHYECTVCGEAFDKTIAKIFPVTVQSGKNTILINNTETGYMFFTGPNIQATEGRTIDLQQENDDQYGNRQIRLSVDESIPVKAAGETFYYGIPTSTHKGINILDDIITIDSGVAKEWITTSACRHLYEEKRRGNENIVSTSHYFPNGILTRLGNATLDMSYGVNDTGYILALSDDGVLYTTNRAVHGNCDNKGGYTDNFSRSFTRESNEIPFTEVSSMEKNAAALCSTGQICVINTDFIAENNAYTDEMYEKYKYDWYFDEYRPKLYYTDPSVTFVQSSAGAERIYGLDVNGCIRQIYADGTFSEPINSIKYQYISSGYDHYLAIDENGNIWAWGKNKWGQVGNGTKGDNMIESPIQITNDIYFTNVSAGSQISAAVDSDYNVYTWGLNNYQQTGLMKDALNDVHEPVLLYNVRHVHTYQNRNSIKEDFTVSCGQPSKITLKCSECGEETEILTEPKEHEYMKPLYNFIHWYEFKKALTDEPLLKYSEGGTTYEYTANKPDLYTVLVKKGNEQYLYAFTNNSCLDPLNSPERTVFHRKDTISGSVNYDADLDAEDTSFNKYILIPNSTYVTANGTVISEKHFYSNIYMFNTTLTPITDSYAEINTDEVIEVPLSEESIESYVYKTLYDRAYAKFDFNQPCEGTHMERRVCKHCYHAIEEEVEGHHEFSLTGNRTTNTGYNTYVCKKCGFEKNEPITYTLKFKLPTNYNAFWGEPEKKAVALKYDEEYVLPDECENSGTFYFNFGPYSLTEDGKTHIVPVRQVVDCYVINGHQYFPGDTVSNLTNISDMYLTVEVYYKWDYEGDSSDLLGSTLYYKNSKYSGAPLVTPAVRTGIANQQYWGSSSYSGWIACIDAWSGMTYNYKSSYNYLCLVKPGLTLDVFNKNLSCASQSDDFATDLTLATYLTDFSSVSDYDYAGLIFSSFDELYEEYPEYNTSEFSESNFTIINNAYIYKNSNRYGDRPVYVTGCDTVYRSAKQTLNGKPYYIYVIPNCWDFLDPADNGIVLYTSGSGIYINDNDPLNITTRYNLHYADPSTGISDYTLNENSVYVTTKISDVKRGYLSADGKKVLTTWTTDKEGKNTVYSQKGLHGLINLYPLWENIDDNVTLSQTNIPTFKFVEDIREGDVYSPNDIVLIGENKANRFLELLGYNATSTDVTLNTDNDNLIEAFERHVSGSTHLPAITDNINESYLIRGDVNEIRVSKCDDSVKERIGNRDIFHTSHNAYINYGGSPVYGEIVRDDSGNIKLLSENKLYSSGYMYTAYSTLDIVKSNEILSDGETDYVYLTANGPKSVFYNESADTFTSENGNDLKLSTRVYKKNDVYLVNSQIPKRVITTNTAAWSNIDIDAIVIDENSYSYYTSDGNVLTKQEYTNETLKRLYDSYVVLHYNGFNDFSDFVSAYVIYALENGYASDEIFDAAGFYILNFPLDKEVKKHRFYVEKYTVKDIDTDKDRRTVVLEPSIVNMDTYSEKAYEYQPTSVSAEALKTPKNSEWHLKYEADHYEIPFYMNFLDHASGYSHQKDYADLITPILNYKEVSQKITFHIDSWDAYNAIDSVPNIYLYNKNGKNISLNNRFGVTIKESDLSYLPLDGEHVEEIFGAQGTTSVADNSYESYVVLTKEGHIWANGGDLLSAYGGYHTEQNQVGFSGRYYEYQKDGGYQDFVRMGNPDVVFKKVLFRYGQVMAIDEEGNFWASSTTSATTNVGFRQISKGIRFSDFAKYNYYYMGSGMYLLDEEGNIWAYYESQGSADGGLNFLAYFQGSEYQGARELNSNEAAGSYGFPVILVQLTDNVKYVDLIQAATGGVPCLQAIDENGDLWLAGQVYETIGRVQDSTFTWDTSDVAMSKRSQNSSYILEKFTRLNDIYDTYKDVKWKKLCIVSDTYTDGYSTGNTVTLDNPIAYIDEDDNLWRVLNSSVGYVVTEQNVKDYNGMNLLDTDGYVYNSYGYETMKGINENPSNVMFDGKKFNEMGNVQQFYYLTDSDEYFIPNTTSSLYHHYIDTYDSISNEAMRGYDKNIFFNGYALYNSLGHSNQILDTSVKKPLYVKDGDVLGHAKGYDVTVDIDYLSELDNIQFENGDSIKVDTVNNTKMNVITDARLYTYGLVDDYITDENETEDIVKSETPMTKNTLNIRQVTKDMDGAQLFLRSLYNLDAENYYSNRITLSVEALRELKAEYTGDPVIVGRNADPNDIKLTLVYEDNHEIEITYADLTDKPDTLPITVVGDNPFTLSFHDKSATVNIPGIYGIVSAVATYPESVWKGNEFESDKIALAVTYSDNSVVNATVTDAAFTDRTVANIGDNSYTFDYSDGTYGIEDIPLTVQGYYYKELKAVYEGEDVKINQNYLKSDAKVEVFYTENSFNRISDILTADEWYSEYTGEEPPTRNRLLNSPVIRAGLGLLGSPLMANPHNDDLKVRLIGDNDFTVGLRADDAFTSPMNVKGVDWINNLSAVYNGPDIHVGNDYDKDDVTVTAIYESGEREVIPTADWTESSLLVENDGNNGYTATYNGLTANYTVRGFVETGISADYRGPDIVVGNNYNKDHVDVKLLYSNGTSRVIPSSDWTESGLLVENVGNNTYTATYNSFTDDYTVNGIDAGDHLEVIYNGPDIYVGTNYNKADVLVKVVLVSGTKVPLNPTDWSESSLLVENVGNNDYVATYNGLTGTYHVPGYKEDHITADYKGTDIPIGDNYNKADVEVKVYYTNHTVDTVPTDSWTEDSLKVSKIGENDYVATYKGLTDDYKVNGYDAVDHLEAVYKGDPILTGNNYKKEDVSVVLKYRSGKEEIINTSDWQESSLKVEKEGNNDYTASYHGLNAPYIVPGYKKIVKITAVYNGDPVIVNTDYKKEDVTVTAYFHDDSTITVPTAEWKESSLRVTKINDNTFTATYKDLTAPYVVIGFPDNDVIISMKAEYKGDPIYIGENYRKDDVDVVLIFKSGKTVNLPPSNWKESSLKVEKIGNNDYVASYKNFTAPYIVPGKDRVKEPLPEEPKKETPSVENPKVDIPNITSKSTISPVKEIVQTGDNNILVYGAMLLGFSFLIDVFFIFLYKKKKCRKK